MNKAAGWVNKAFYSVVAILLLLAFTSNSFLSASAKYNLQATATPTPIPSSLLTDLVAYWDMDESSGTRDDAAGSNDLSDNNTVTQASGVGTETDHAAQFTAANSEYLTSDSADLDVGNIDFTITSWVYLDSLPGNYNPMIAAKREPSGNDTAYRLYLSGFGVNRFRFDINDGAFAGIGVTASTPVINSNSLGHWYFVVAGHDAANDKIFIQVNNGTKYETSTGGVSPGSSTYPLYVGWEYNVANYYLNGRMDELGFWKRVLTAEEITTLYNSGAGLTYPFLPGSVSPTTNISAYWDLDESSGTRDDAIGSSDLTDINTVTQAGGVSSQTDHSAHFAASSSEYLTSDSVDLDISNIDFTITSWVYLDSLPGNYNPMIVAKRRGTGNPADYRLYLSGFGVDRFRFDINDGGVGVTASTPVIDSNSIGQWYFVAAWHDAAHDKIFIQINNGTEYEADTNNVSPGSSTYPLYVGWEYNVSNYYLNGRLDELGFWKRVLNAQERSALYNNGNGWAYPFPTFTPTSTPTPTFTPTSTPTPTQTPTSTPTLSYTYNRSAAVNYADNWAHEPRNSVYPLSTLVIKQTGCTCQNCTNFMSQVLQAGTYPTTDPAYDYTGQSWWYNPSTETSSESWRLISAFFNNTTSDFHRHEFDVSDESTVATPPPTITDGDLILLDLGNNADPNNPDPDDIPDHVRIVVGYDNTSTNSSDYLSECVGAGTPTSTPIPVPTSSEMLLIDQNCVDRRHVAWNLQTDGIARWFIHVK